MSTPAGLDMLATGLLGLIIGANLRRFRLWWQGKRVIKITYLVKRWH